MQTYVGDCIKSVPSIRPKLIGRHILEVAENWYPTIHKEIHSTIAFTKWSNELNVNGT